MIVHLSAEETALCGEFGRLRTEENKNRSDIADYDSNRFHLTSLQANRLGVMVEMAAAKLIGMPDEVIRGEVPSQWAAFVPSEQYSQYLGQADLAGCIEVRRANKEYSPIPMRGKDKGSIILQGFVPYTQEVKHGPIRVSSYVDFLGWADVDADWEKGVKPSWATVGSKALVLHEKRDMADFNVAEVLGR